MGENIYQLIIPAFIAGLFTFLAPCTFPLVPGYLGFISGTSAADLRDPNKISAARWKIFANGLLYVFGFSVVFIFLGSLFGLGGVALLHYRVWLSRIGGVFVIFFGLYMMNLLRLPALKFLETDKHLRATRWLRPGNPVSSFLFGATFAFGWTPCVGPILGSVLLLASTRGTVGDGAFLLAIFSAGLALPFLIIALLIGSAARFLHRFNRYLHVISVIGGVFLVFLGILLLTNMFGEWIGIFYKFFGFFDIEARLLRFL